jgi:hypothetical protein
MAEPVAELLRAVLGDPDAVARYSALVIPGAPGECSWWIGAVAGKGHGRFWLGTDRTGRGCAIIAHRFGYALTYGVDALMSAPLLAHWVCDEPLCQNSEHVRPSSVAANTAEWAWRRHRVGGSLRDQRGARQRSLAIRAALLRGLPPPEAVRLAHEAGMRPVDRGQDPLFS